MSWLSYQWGFLANYPGAPSRPKRVRPLPQARKYPLQRVLKPPKAPEVDSQTLTGVSERKSFFLSVPSEKKWLAWEESDVWWGEEEATTTIDNWEVLVTNRPRQRRVYPEKSCKPASVTPRRDDNIR